MLNPFLDIPLTPAQRLEEMWVCAVQLYDQFVTSFRYPGREANPLVTAEKTQDLAAAWLVTADYAEEVVLDIKGIAESARSLAQGAYNQYALTPGQRIPWLYTRASRIERTDKPLMSHHYGPGYYLSFEDSLGDCRSCHKITKYRARQTFGFDGPFTCSYQCLIKSHIPY